MKELIEKYCSKNPSNVDRVGAPWSEGDFTYATDGHILIRLPRIADVPGNDSAPNMSKPSKLNGTFGEEPAEWVGIPEVNYSRDTCPACKGTALAHMCPECEDEGIAYPATKFNTYEVECRTCEGVGQISEAEWTSFKKAHRFRGEPILDSCDKCHATGVTWTLEGKKIGGVKINLKFLSMIGELPGASLGTFGPKDPVRFKFDGGEGLVMPMEPDKEVPE